jgi:hypothetical protein
VGFGVMPPHPKIRFFLLFLFPILSSTSVVEMGAKPKKCSSGHNFDITAKASIAQHENLWHKEQNKKE